MLLLDHEEKRRAIATTPDSVLFERSMKGFPRTIHGKLEFALATRIFFAEAVRVPAVNRVGERLMIQDRDVFSRAATVYIGCGATVVIRASREPQ